MARILFLLFFSSLFFMQDTNRSSEAEDYLKTKEIIVNIFQLTKRSIEKHINDGSSRDYQRFDTNKDIDITIQLTVSDNLSEDRVTQWFYNAYQNAVIRERVNVSSNWKINYHQNPNKGQIPINPTVPNSKERQEKNERLRDNDGQKYQGAIYYGNLKVSINGNRENGRLSFDNIDLQLYRNFIPANRQDSDDKEDKNVPDIVLENPVITGLKFVNYRSELMASQKLSEQYRLLENNILLKKTELSTSEDILDSFKVQLYNFPYIGNAEQREDLPHKPFDLYFTHHGLRRLGKFYENYFTQKDVYLLRENQEKFIQIPEDRELRKHLKYDMFTIQGSNKISNAPLHNRYKYDRPDLIEEFRKLPYSFRQHFRPEPDNPHVFTFLPSDILPMNNHLLSIRDGEIRDITLYPVNLLERYRIRLSNFLQRPPDYNLTPIELDLMKFFADYSTTLLIKDKEALNLAWMDIAIRSYISGEGNREKAYGERITNDIFRLSERYDLWVKYEEDGELNFFIFDEDEFKHVREPDGRKVIEMADFLIATNMKQIWIDFDRHQRQAVYISQNVVQFILNVFHIPKIREKLNTADLNLLDMVGLWGYLRYLFNDDSFNQTLKAELKERYKIIPLLCDQDLSLLDNRMLRDVMNDLADFRDYINSNEKGSKEELIRFFDSSQHEVLHLEYSPYHEVFIQIIASYTYDDDDDKIIKQIPNILQPRERR